MWERKVRESPIYFFSKYRDILSIIHKVIHSHQPVLISDKGKSLVKIIPFPDSEPTSWLGSMRGTGKIMGDIISPVEDPDIWEVLSP